MSDIINQTNGHVPLATLLMQERNHKTKSHNVVKETLQSSPSLMKSVESSSQTGQVVDKIKISNNRTLSFVRSLKHFISKKSQGRRRTENKKEEWVPLSYYYPQQMKNVKPVPLWTGHDVSTHWENTATTA